MRYGSNGLNALIHLDIHLSYLMEFMENLFIANEEFDRVTDPLSPLIFVAMADLTENYKKEY
jgi:hypothetical protein